MNNLVHLNIFTNTNANKEYFDYLKQAYDSFVNIWGKHPTTIWFDPHPNEDPAFVTEYKNHLKSQLPDVPIVMTESHREGWMRGILESTTEYIFNLEHDFKLQNINHSLDQIIDCMREDKLVYMHFQKHANNEGRVFDKIWGYDQSKPGEIPIPKYNQKNNLYYFTKPTCPNQPQIVNREIWEKYIIPYNIKRNASTPENWKGRGGIERYMQLLKPQIPELREFHFGCYGDFKHPTTAHHLDARKKEPKIKPPSEPWNESFEY